MRGGLIDTKNYTKEIDEIMNLKKPSKLKILKMIFTILKKFFGSMYFFTIILFVWILRKIY